MGLRKVKISILCSHLLLTLCYLISFGSGQFIFAQSAPDKALLPDGFAPQYQGGFVKNMGQIVDQNGKPNSAVKYLWNGNGLNVQLRANGFSYDTYKVETDSAKLAQWRKAKQADPTIQADTLTGRFHRVDVFFPGANVNVNIVPTEKLAAITNIFRGANEKFKNIEQFGKVTYKNIYPGIDLEFYARSDEKKPVEYNFVVHPGADARAIRMQYLGADDVQLNKEGNIELTLGTGTMQEVIPASWVGDEKSALDVSYVQEAKGVYRFDVPHYDAQKTLTIDPAPVIVFGTFTYNNANNYKVEVDEAGNVLVFFGLNRGFPSVNYSTAGAYQTTIPGYQYEWLFQKYNQKGQLLISTYFGSSVNDPNGYIAGNGFLRYKDGNIYFASSANAKNMQTSGMPAYNVPASGNSFDVFLLKMSATNLYPVWGQYFGGTGGESPWGLDVDANGNLVLQMITGSQDLPRTAPFTAYSGSKTQWVAYAKFDSNGNRIWSRPTQFDESNFYSSIGYFAPQVAAAPDGSFYAMGMQLQYTPISGSTKLGTNTSPYYFTHIFKFAGDGQITWTRYFEGRATNQGDYNAMATDNNSNLWIIGNNGFDYRNNMATPGSYPYTANARQTDVPAWYLTAPISVYAPVLTGIKADGSDFLYSSMDFPTPLIKSPDGYAYQFPSSAYSIAWDRQKNEMITFRGLSGMTATSDNVSPCADGLPGSNILSRKKTDGEVVWETSWGLPENVGYGTVMSLNSGKLSIMTQISYKAANQYTTPPTPIQLPYLDDKLTTPGAYKRNSEKSQYGNSYSGVLLFVMEDFQGVPDGLVLSPNTLSPATQMACINGIPQTIEGTKVKVLQPTGVDVPLVYQWQESTTATGPWKNVSGATGKNYTPVPLASGQKYFRRLVKTLNAECNLETIDSSGSVELKLSNTIAPNAQAGDPKYFLCPGNSITLDATANGGSGSGYQYSWYIGGETSPAATTASFTHSPTATTVYILRVEDSAGCTAIDQVAVEPVKANAGPDLSFCQGSEGVRIGAPPHPGYHTRDVCLGCRQSIVVYQLCAACCFRTYCRCDVQSAG